MYSKQIVVVGAGASGMMAAGRAAECGANVILLEKTNHTGNKIRVSGRTRCNLTNEVDLDTFISMYGENGHFLFSAFSHYFRDDLLALLRRYGVETKVELNGRIFPASDDARDVVRALQLHLAENKVQIHNGINVSRILVNKGQVTGVQSETKTYPARAVILATGGASYPSTGSTGDGYSMAKEIGHTIVPVRPAQVPLVVAEKKCAISMQGVSLYNIRLTAYRCHADEIDIATPQIRDSGRGIPGKHPRSPVLESRRGDMILTHFGISGPVALRMSLAIVDALKQGPVSVSIDLSPEQSISELRLQLKQHFSHHGNKNYSNFLKILLPPKLITPFIDLTGIPPDKHCHQISTEERERLLYCLKSIRFNIKRPLSLASAMVTAGGISLTEIDPRTMASRKVAGLYFCGEVMDLDAETGGYNLQAAFSTGYVAGENAASYVAYY